MNRTLPGLAAPRPRGATPWTIGAETTAFALDEDEKALAEAGVFLRRLDKDVYEARQVRVRFTPKEV